MKYLVMLLFYIFISNYAFANELTVVAVGEAELEAEKIVFNPITDLSDNANKAKIEDIVSLFKNNFNFYKKNFNATDSKTLNIRFDHQNYDIVSTNKIRYWVDLKFLDKLTDLAVTVSVVDILNKKEVLNFEDSINKIQYRTNVHIISDKIFNTITGKPSIFISKIVFVSDLKSSKSKIIKELYMMDFDGGNKRQLTNHRGIVISPAISHDKTKVIYSLIREGGGVRNVDLYLLDLTTSKATMLSNRKGLNSGAVFSEDDKRIYLTLSSAGNSEIYEMNLATKVIRQITRNPSIDVDPSVNRDGSLMAFLSGRPGKAMIYTLDPSGTEKNTKRVSFVGQYNATPRFDPEGKQIVFASWLDNCFDIFRINSDGSGLVRLTKNFGSNEDPTYSNDGQFIAFSSQRVISSTKATHKVYIMDKDGVILGSVTDDFGNCITPRWSK